MEIRRYRLMGTVGLLLLLVVILSACASNGGESGAGGGGGVSDTGAPGDDAGSQDIAMTEDMPSSGKVASDTQAASAGVSAQPQGASVSSAQSQSLTQTLPTENYDRKIVKTASLGIRSDDVRGSAAEAQQIAARYGGAILSSQLTQYDAQKEGQLYADLVLSVPSQEFEGAIAELRGLGKKVTQDSVSGQDVTEEFVDLEARERNLLATEKSLLKLYDRANSIEDTITIQRELTGVRGEIELVQGRMKYLKARSDFSQITLHIEPPVIAPKPEPKPTWEPGAVAARAWAASLNVLQAAATVGISALVFGWWLIPLIVLGLVWWRRRNRSMPAGSS
ncbi:hypothetical protein BH18ACT10_BH18ACT10_07110 [soil metagenome]